VLDALRYMVVRSKFSMWRKFRSEASRVWYLISLEFERWKYGQIEILHFRNVWKNHTNSLEKVFERALTAGLEHNAPSSFGRTTNL
jgi:hypothetical protein